MRALLLKQYKQLEVTEMPEPAIGPDDVLVAVKACGICGSDVHSSTGPRTDRSLQQVAPGATDSEPGLLRRVFR